MKWFVLLLGAPLALAVESLKLASYNVENYTLANRMVDGVYRENYPKPESAKAALREVIRALQADVLALQEMGGRAFLQELQRDLRAEGCDYPHAEILDAADQDRRLGVLSRRPFAAVHKHADLSFMYFGVRETVKRGLLEVRFPLAVGELAVFVVHLKSRYTDRADDPASATRRGAEATAVRNRILEQFPKPSESRFVILGDFNDAKNSPGVRFILSRGKTSIAELLPAADSRGDRWTHRYAKEDSYSRVDHVLVSPGLRGSARDGRAGIYDGNGVAAASDHRPVWVTLEFN